MRSDAFDVPIGDALYRIETPRRAPSGLLATVTVFVGDDVRHSDRLNLDHDKERERYGGKAGVDPKDLLIVRETILDKLNQDVSEKRKEPNPELGDVPDGAELFVKIETFIRCYCVFPSEPAYVTVVLWVAHAHAIDAAESTPRLSFLSPEPECGKTRALEIIELLTPHPMLAVNATPAALFRAVSDLEHRPTILFDEIDTIFGPKAKENEELRGLLNAGHRRSGVAYRCVGEGKDQEVRAFPAYAAVALAGIGDLPDTILSRSIVIPMRRRRADEQVTPFRRRAGEQEGHALRDALAAWCRANAEPLAAVPAMPDGITDRAADTWEPLLAIADAAGGDWPKRARAAAVALVAEKSEKEPSLGVRLLGDIRQVFSTIKENEIPTAALVAKLCELDEAPWSNLRGKPLDARGLARRLSQYKIKPKTLRVGDTTPRGYERAAFSDAWERYLPAEKPGESPEDSDKSDEPDPSVTEVKHPKHPQQLASERGNDVADSGPCFGRTQNNGTEPQHENRMQSGLVADVLDVSDVWEREEASALSHESDYCRVCGRVLPNAAARAVGLCAEHVGKDVPPNGPPIDDDDLCWDCRAAPMLSGYVRCAACKEKAGL